jgi:hypothetical protein
VYNKDVDEDDEYIKLTNKEDIEKRVLNGETVCHISEENAYDFKSRHNMNIH